ncbi:MAG: hypothetical protein GX868_15335 [Actinobacteria bacterium]|nr:hypothetical protein [Actinomycetota bacterium]
MAAALTLPFTAACGSDSSTAEPTADDPTTTADAATPDVAFCTAFDEFLTTYGATTREQIAVDPAAFIAAFDGLITQATGAASPLGGAFRDLSVNSLDPATATSFDDDDLSTVASFWNAADTECTGRGWSNTVDAKTATCRLETSAWATAVNAAEVSRSYDPASRAGDFIEPSADLRFQALWLPNGTEAIVATYPANPCGF